MSGGDAAALAEPNAVGLRRDALSERFTLFSLSLPALVLVVVTFRNDLAVR